MNAVALQDHLVNSLSLQDPFKQKVNHKVKNNANQKKTETRKSTTKLDDNKEYVLDAKPKPLTLGTLTVFYHCNQPHSQALHCFYRDQSQLNTKCTMVLGVLQWYTVL